MTTPPIIAQPTATRRFDLACGQRPREGFEGIDIYEKAQHVWDLNQFPWQVDGAPIPDSSVAELYCSHYIEHIPQYPLVNGQNPFFAFFDECWRIMAPGAWMTIVVPNAFSNRGFQDPTHTRYIVAETFAYLNPEFRKGNMLDHYNVRCNFIGGANPMVSQDLTLLHPDAARLKMTHQINQISDWEAKLQAVKP